MSAKWMHCGYKKRNTFNQKISIKIKSLDKQTSFSAIIKKRIKVIYSKESEKPI